MSGKGDNPTDIWAGKGIVATDTGEGAVRMWNLDNEDNYILSLDGYNSYDSNENVMCISYSQEKGMLAGGTNMGDIALWKWSPPIVGKKVEGEQKWKLQAPATVESSIRQVELGSSKNLLAVNTIANVFMLNEHTMSSGYKDQTAVVQYGPSSLSVEMFATGQHHDLKTEIQVKGIYTTKDALALWYCRRVITYDYAQDKASIKAAGTFTIEAMVVCLYEQHVYCIEPAKVQVRTHQGTVKQVLNFNEVEGQPASIDVCANYLVIATSNGIVRVYDLSRREAKAHTQHKNLSEVIPGFGGIVSCKCNCNGTKVSLMVRMHDGHVDPKLYFWDVETDTVTFFNFESGRGEQDDYPAEQIEGLEVDTNDAEREKTQAAKHIAGRTPISHHWDHTEPKLIICQAQVLASAFAKKEKGEKKTHSLSKSMDEGPVEVMIVSLFSTPENGTLIQDSFPMPEPFQALLGVEVPYYYFVKKIVLGTTRSVIMSSKLEKLQMQDTVDFHPSHLLIVYYCEMNLLEVKPKLPHCCLLWKADIPTDIIGGKYTTLMNDEINYTEMDMQTGRLKAASPCKTSGINKIILIEQDSPKEIMILLENDVEERFTKLQTFIDSVSNYGNKLSNNCFHLQWTKKTFVKQCYSNTLVVNKLPTDAIKVKDAMLGNILPWSTASRNNITPPFVHAPFFTNEQKENSKVIFASLFCKLEGKEKLQETSNIKLHNVYLPGFFRNKDGSQNVDRIMELMFSSLICRTIVSLSSYEITPLHNFFRGVTFKVIDIVDLVSRLFNRIRNMTDYIKKYNSFSIQNNRINRNDEATYKDSFVHRYLQRKRHSQRMSNLTISLLTRNLELTMLVLTLGLLTSASCQDINVSWNMESNMTLFRKTAELTCVISDYDHSCNRTIRQWYGGNPYVFLCRDGACRHQGKYVEKQDSMCKYTLKIYNFSENDVNCDYTCAYGVQSSRKMLKLDKKLFAYVPTMDEVKYTVKVDKVMLNASVYIPKAFPEPSCQASFAGSKISSKSEINSIGDLYKTVITINYIPSVTICEGVLEIKCMIGSSVFTPVFDNITVCTVTSDKKSQPTESNTAVYVVVGIFIAIVVVIALYMVKKIHKGKGLTKTCRKCTGYHQSPTEEERNV